MGQSQGVNDRLFQRPGSRMGHHDDQEPDRGQCEVMGSPELVDGSVDKPNMSQKLDDMNETEDQPNGDPASNVSKLKTNSAAFSRKTDSRQRPRYASAKAKEEKSHCGSSRSTSPSSKRLTNSERTISPSQKRAIDHRRNRAAVKALREGSLKKEKKYDTSKDVYEPEPVQVISPRLRNTKAPSSSSSSSESDFEIPKSQQEEEIFNMRQHLLRAGVSIPYKTLKRGLTSPSERGYDECLSQLPRKSSLSLLNQPDMWLGEVYRKYQLADKALRKANATLAMQAEQEQKQAAKATAATKKPCKKKVRTGKRKVTRTKKPGSVT